MKRTMSVFLISALAALPAALVLAAASPTQALYRRISSIDACRAGVNITNKLSAGPNYLPLGIVGGTQGLIAQASCFVPNDNFFPLVAVDEVRVYAKRVRPANVNWNMAIRACAQSPSSDAYACGAAYTADPALGEKTLMLTSAAQLSVWHSPAYSSGLPYVSATFLQDDVVRSIAVSTY